MDEAQKCWGPQDEVKSTIDLDIIQECTIHIVIGN